MLIPSIIDERPFEGKLKPLLNWPSNLIKADQIKSIVPLDISSSCARKFKLVAVVVDIVFIVFAEIKSLYKRALSLSFLPFTPPSCGHFYLI